jgi:hypothetical protein
MDHPTHSLVTILTTLSQLLPEGEIVKENSHIAYQPSFGTKFVSVNIALCL